MKLRLAAVALLASGLCSAQTPTPKPQQAATKRIRIGGQVQQAMLTKKVLPEYPAPAKQARVQGTVRLEALISTEGTVRELKVLSGHPLLLQSALDAVRQWRYKPTLLNGQAVEVLTTIDVVYTLGGIRETSETEADAIKAEQAALAAVDPATAADIRRMMEVTGSKKLGMQLAAPLFEQIKPTVLRAMPPGERSEKVANRLMEMLMAKVNDEHFLDIVIPTYARHFTHDEIKQILAFFESPIGQRYVLELQPMLQEVQTAAMNHWNKVTYPQIMREMAEEFPELKQLKQQNRTGSS